MSDWMIAELYLLAYAVKAGVIFRACYDVWLISSSLHRPGTFLTLVWDVCYWLGGCMFTFRMLYYANDGIIRGFALCGIFAGMWLYHQLASPLVVRLVCRCCHAAIRQGHLWSGRLCRWGGKKRVSCQKRLKRKGE